VTGVVHEVNDGVEIVDKYYPGAICGTKHLLDTGTALQSTSLMACTEVEMVEFNIGCSLNQFYQILRENPVRCASHQKSCVFRFILGLMCFCASPCAPGAGQAASVVGVTRTTANGFADSSSYPWQRCKAISGNCHQRHEPTWAGIRTITSKGLVAFHNHDNTLLQVGASSQLHARVTFVS
jgi:hypothetical protein